MSAKIWNLVAGILATLGGVVLIYLAWFDPNPMVMVGAVIALLSGLAWTISAMLGL